MKFSLFVQIVVGGVLLLVAGLYWRHRRQLAQFEAKSWPEQIKVLR